MSNNKYKETANHAQNNNLDSNKDSQLQEEEDKDYQNEYPSNDPDNYSANNYNNYPSNYPNNNNTNFNNYPAKNSKDDNNAKIEESSSNTESYNKSSIKNKNQKNFIPNVHPIVNTNPQSINDSKEKSDIDSKIDLSIDSESQPNLDTKVQSDIDSKEKSDIDSKSQSADKPESDKEIKEKIAGFKKLLEEKIKSFRVLRFKISKYVNIGNENGFAKYEKSVSSSPDLLTKSGIQRIIFRSNSSTLPTLNISSPSIPTSISADANSEIGKMLIYDKMKQCYLAHIYEKVPTEFNGSYLAGQISFYIQAEQMTLARFHGYSTKDQDGNFCPTVFMERPVNGPLVSLFQQVRSNFSEKAESDTIIKRSDSFNIDQLTTVTDEQKFAMICGITFATAYIHENGFIHSNLNPTTVYLDENLWARICDYVFIPPYKVDKTGIDTYQFKFESKPSPSQFRNVFYVAPEILEGEVFDSKSDIYSLGLLMYFILAEEEARMNDLGEIEYPDGFDDEWKKLINRCILKDPTERPRAFSILKNELFNMNKANLYFSKHKFTSSKTMAYLSIIESSMQGLSTDLEDEEVKELDSSDDKLDIFHLMIPNILDLDEETCMIIHAAEEGDVKCIEKVGDFFYNGFNNIHQDEEWACVCYELVAKKENLRCMKLAAELNFKLIGDDLSIQKAYNFCEKVLKKIDDTDPDKPKFESMKNDISDQLFTFIIRIPSTSKMDANKLKLRNPKIKFESIPMPSIEGQDGQRIKLKFENKLDKMKMIRDINIKYNNNNNNQEEKIIIEQQQKLSEKVETHRFKALSHALTRYELDEFFPGEGNTNYEKLGEGAFASTYVAYRKDEPNKKIAAKVFQKQVTIRILNSLKREIIMASKFDHPTILKYLGYNEHSLINKFGGQPEESNVYFPTLIMEFVPNGELESKFKPEEKNPLDDTSKVKIIIGIARGILEMYNHNIVHRDLKPENILLNEKNEPLICDLGCSRQFADNGMGRITNSVGTPIYEAPEQISKDISYNYRYEVDVYAFGIIMYQVLKNVQMLDVYGKSVNTTFKLLNKKMENKIGELNGLDDVFVKLIKECWNASKDNRPDPPAIWERLTEHVDSGTKLLNNENLEEIQEYINKIE